MTEKKYKHTDPEVIERARELWAMRKGQLVNLKMYNPRTGSRTLHPSRSVVAQWRKDELINSILSNEFGL